MAQEEFEFGLDLEVSDDLETIENPGDKAPVTQPQEIKPIKETEEEEDEQKPEPAAPKGETKPKPQTKEKPVEAPVEETQEEGEPEEGPVDFEELTKGLYEKGIFNKWSDDEELPSSTEEFLDRINFEKQKGAEQMIYNFVSKYGEDYEEAFRAIFVNGVDPKTYFGEYNKVVSFKDMDLTDEANQQKIVETSLRNQGWEEEDIKEQISKLKTNYELEDTAKRAFKPLVKKEEESLKKLQEEAQERLAKQKQFEELHTKEIKNILATGLKAGDLEGIPVTKELADKTVEFLDNKKWQLPSGEKLTDFEALIMELNKPQNFKVKAQLALLFGGNFKPGEPLKLNLAPVAKKAVSKESNATFNFLKGKKAKPTDNENDYTFGNNL